ncbi:MULTISPECIES: hypothetical protein [unclassified Streptomyces]|uniref:hypothetical protein n=1 Tax=unclassified Streptomyces TaxID=2593676 RepID=UPI00081F2838|nr:MULTISPECIES: hypothetical protein [unclassified Streptomyces]SCF24785.1 hypothetical protein GA0115257_109112 [Streptomyces sp. LcepLS]
MCGRSVCAGIDLPGHDLEAAPAAVARSCVPHGFTTERRYPASGPQAGKAALDTSRPELLRRPLPRPESVRAAELAAGPGCTARSCRRAAAAGPARTARGPSST